MHPAAPDQRQQQWRRAASCGPGGAAGVRSGRRACHACGQLPAHDAAVGWGGGDPRDRACCGAARLRYAFWRFGCGAGGCLFPLYSESAWCLPAGRLLVALHQLTLGALPTTARCCSQRLGGPCAAWLCPTPGACRPPAGGGGGVEPCGHAGGGLAQATATGGVVRFADGCWWLGVLK